MTSIGFLHGRIPMDRCTRLGLSWFAVSAACCVVAACGAGQSDDTTASVQGNWSGNYTAAHTQSSIPVFALIQQDGPAYLYDGTGVTYVLPSFGGTTDQSGQVTAYPSKGYTFADGSTSMPLAMDAQTTNGRMAIQLSAAPTEAQAQSGQAQLFQLETWYGTPSAATGQWAGFYLSPTPTALALTVDAGGNFTGTDAYGCRLQGRLTQLADQGSLFSLTLQSSGLSSACSGSMTGLVHESAYDSFGFFQGAAGNYYYLCASGSKSAFVAELKAQ